MLLTEHIYHIQHILSDGIPSDDVRLKDRHIYFILKYIRAKLIKQQFDQKGIISPFNYLPIEFLGMSKGSWNDCPGIPTDFPLLKSNIQLPEILMHRNNLMIKSVRTFDGTEIAPSTIDKIKLDKFSRTRKKAIKYFIYNKRLFVYGNRKLRGLWIDAVWEDPLELEKINICDPCSPEQEKPCFDPNIQDFPIEVELVDMLHNLTLQELLRVKQFASEDQVSDARSVSVVPTDAPVTINSKR